jgi:hypothetical protein
MTALTNFGTLTAINSANNAKTATAESVKSLATGEKPDFGTRATINAQVNSLKQGAKNLAIHAGRYEAFVGIGNAITALTQHKLELAVTFSQSGYETSEYQAAGTRYIAIDNHINSLIATAPIGSGNFNAIKTENFAGGRAVVAGPTTRAWQRAANSTTVTGFAAVPTNANMNQATEFSAVIEALKLEVENSAASASALRGIAEAAKVASHAAGIEAAGLSSAFDVLRTDFASETAKLAASKIRNEAALAMVSQASQMDQVMMKLLN